MGVGKTTVGEQLAVRLGRPFYDTDVRVAAAAGRSVDDFFAVGDEAGFRRLESAVVAELLELGPVVIALGGGALLDASSRRLLLERALLVHLHVPWVQLGPHLLAMAETRPLLRGRSQAALRRLYRERLETYRMAPLQVTVSRDDPELALLQVLGALGGATST